MHGVAFCGALSPAGGKRICSKLQRRFAMLSVPPVDGSGLAIFSALVGGYLGRSGFEAHVVAMAPMIGAATIALHAEVGAAFVTSTTTPHYVWGLREICAVARSMCDAIAEHHVPAKTRLSPLAL